MLEYLAVVCDLSTSSFPSSLSNFCPITRLSALLCTYLLAIITNILLSASADTPRRIRGGQHIHPPRRPGYLNRRAYYSDFGDNNMQVGFFTRKNGVREKNPYFINKYLPFPTNSRWIVIEKIGTIPPTDSPDWLGFIAETGCKNR